MPRSMLAMIEGITEEARDELLGVLPQLIKVFACKPCNSVLGNRLYQTIRERREAVKSHLRRKYRRLLKSAPWSDEDLDELGYTLRTLIEHRMELKKQIEQRLAWRRWR